MFSRRKKGPRDAEPGVVWPDSGIASGSSIRDPLGPRPFNAHTGTVGYNYDFHRGIDVVGALGDPTYSPINGAIVRLHQTHFGWEADQQLTQWLEVDPSGTVEFAQQGDTYLRIVGDRSGSQAFTTGAGRYETIEWMKTTNEDWVVELAFSSSISVTGALGIGIYDAANNEYALLEYDGRTFTTLGVDASGSLTADGSGTIAPSKKWMRIEWDDTTDTMSWRHSPDGVAWTDITTDATVVWSVRTRPTFKPVLYWRSTDVAATPETIDIDVFNWIDDQTIPRFGNWYLVADGQRTFMSFHVREFSSSLGDIVRAGQQIGTVGQTGFDVRSGRIQQPHVHLEYMTSSLYFYDNDFPQNPLRDGILPRVNVSNNITVVRTTTMSDPGLSGSHRLAITASRQDQDLDFNEISLTGNLGARTINFDLRSGLNVDNDIPFNDGVYIVPELFNESDTEYIISLYFHTSSVGPTFSSASIKDSSGNVLWEEGT